MKKNYHSSIINVCICKLFQEVIMKNVIKRGLSLILAITIIFGSAVVGFGEIDFSGLFTVKAKAASESDLTFKLNEDGESYSVTGCNELETGELVIPSTHNGFPVTSISNAAFYCNNSILTVNIPSSILTIGWRAFAGCYNLTNVNLSYGLVTIDEEAFFECTKLKSIIIPDSVTVIEESAFDLCSSLNDITISSNVSLLGIYAFRGTAYYDNHENWENNVLYLDNYLLRGDTTFDGVCYIKEGTTVIAEYAFYNCDLLTSVVFPDSMVKICTYAFAECDRLTSVEYKKCNVGLDSYVYFHSPLSDMEYVHLFSDEWTIDIVPTCITEGSKSHHCLRCGSKAGVTVIEATGHSYGEFNVTAESTCTNPGSKTKNCSVCGDVVTETIAVLGHDFSTEWTVDAEPTCTKEGSKSHHCSRCEEKNDVTEIIATGHNYVDGLCTTCNKTIGVEYLTFELNSDNESYSVTGCNASAEGEIVIPSTYNGLPVTDIKSYAFDDYKNLTSITIPNSIINIGEYAFYNCTSITSIVVPDSVLSIGKYAFYNCINLVSVKIGEGVTNIGYSCFNNCKSLENVYWNAENVSDITTSSYIFLNAGISGEGIAFEFGNTVENIPSYIFYTYSSSNAPKVISIKIGCSVDSLHKDIYDDCNDLKSIDVSDDNINFSSVEGVLFNKDKTKILRFPVSKTDTEYSIPSSVTSIGSSAFYNCANLKSIRIPDGVTVIEGNAFYGCTGLEKIYWDAINVADFTSTADVFYNAGTKSAGIEIVFGDNVKTIPAYFP